MTPLRLTRGSIADWTSPSGALMLSHGPLVGSQPHGSHMARSRALARLACVVLVVLPMQLPAQRPPRAAEDPVILRIRAHFTVIEREASTYQCRSLDLEGFSAEGGSLEACYAGRELRRLSATYLGETGRASERYYFWNDSLEFLFGKVEHYDRPLSGRVRSTEEERLYWNRGQLIRWLQGKTRQPLTNAAARERNSEARESARKLAACAAKGADSTCEA